jgi:hypothetical protein
MKTLRWKIAAVIVAAIAIVTAVTVPQWTVSADGDRWAIVRDSDGMVVMVSEIERIPPNGHSVVKVPDGVLVLAANHRYVDGQFVRHYRVAPPTATLTPTTDAGGTAPLPTVAPTATSTPEPTATPDPEAATLEDLQDMVDQLQLEVIDLQNRMATQEAR